MDVVTLALAKKYARQVGSTITSITATDTGIHFVTSTGEFDVNLDGWTGSKDYIDLINKPSINSTELVGNKTLTELGISQVGQTGNYNDLTNKPSIPTKTSELQNDSGFIKAGDIPNIPTKTSDLQNDSGFITKTVSDLVNYYNKTETFTKQEVQDLVRTVSGLQMKVVDSLPEMNVDTQTIYLLKTSGGNSYEQWVYIDNQWFKLGTTDINLVDYYTKAQADEKFVQKETGKGLSSNDFTNEDKTKLNGIENGANNYSLPVASKTVLGGVKIGKNLSADVDGTLNVDLPSIEEKGTIVTVNNIPQITWNADVKANVTDIPTKTSELQNDNGFITSIDIPTKTSQLTNDSGFITNANIPTKTSQLENDSNFISTVPQATTQIGGIRANPKTELDTTEVRIDSNTGYLYCSGGGGSGGNLDSKQDKPVNNTTIYGVNSGNYTGEDLYTVAIGGGVLKDNIGRFNCGLGFSVLSHNTTGTNNTGCGLSTLYNNSTGNSNTALGAYSLVQNKTGTNNTGIGSSALEYKIDGSPGADLINTTGVGYKASVSGDNQVQLGDSSTTTYCYGAIQNRSDRRDKSDIKETELGLTFINSLRPVEFKWDYRDDYFKDELQKDGTVKRVPIPKDGSKKRNRPHQGFIAQEVKEVTDNLNVDFGGYQDHSINGGCDVLSLGYEEFIAPIVKSIQEQQQIIESQNKKIEMLETKLNEILAK